MDFSEAFKNKELIKRLSSHTNSILKELGRISVMEVCGTHTMEIFRFGIKKLYNDNLNMISGPGCPVCVTDNRYLDTAIALAGMSDVIITTFGDMMRVPGSRSSLQEERASGKDIRVVYSPLDALKMAGQNPEKKVIFLGVGFETTAPTIAATIKMASKQDVKNFFVLASHKTMPNAMEALLSSGEIKINGFICPGHVTAITGIHIYDFIPLKYKVPCVVSGFEPLDIVRSIDLICMQLKNHEPKVQNSYSRVVQEHGNPAAQQVMKEVLEKCDAVWRGIGMIPGSGLKIRQEYSDFDAEVQFPVEIQDPVVPEGCRCGEVLTGAITPLECPLFKEVCTPENPVGSCMVSSEGTCAAYYKYHF